MTDETAVIKTALERASLPFDLCGAVIFGSRAQNTATPSSDLDLLVVARGLEPKRHRRGEQIYLLKKLLPPIPLDILLLTPDETASNFRNHNPLFLDLAEDGIILLDRGDLLRSLMEQTREYVRARGIKRLDGGWQFPVRFGAASYLSNVSNQDFASAMLTDAERDRKIGRKLIEEGFYDKAVYHFQQSVEKSVKSVLACFGIFHKTHFVGEILIKAIHERQLPEKWSEKLAVMASISEAIEPDVSLSRYPGIVEDSLWLPYEEYEREDADKAEAKAAEALLTARDFTSYWFAEQSKA